ncbi:MAG: hypothetical protein E7436_02280 [Ruminococcaceae bacterium]|nr:hypothetical protein [Oscillospiraceae bacterium]
MYMIKHLQRVLYRGGCPVGPIKREDNGMKRKILNRWLSIALAAVMLLGMLPGTALQVFAAGEKYVLDVAQDVATFDTGAKADGETETAGTDDFFTIFYSAKSRVDGSNKNFDDGYSTTTRINFGGSTVVGDNTKNAIMFKTTGAAKIKVWWVGGDVGRQQAIYSSTGTVLSKTSEDTVKNSLYISELTVDEAGTYFLGNVGGNNYYFKVEVTITGGGSGPAQRAEWSSVAAPEIVSAADNGEGKIEVTVNALVGPDGGDEILVTMYDAAGKEVASKRSVGEKSSHVIEFEPTASGTYTFKAVLNREGETGKAAAAPAAADFIFPLGTPVLTSATSKGDGKVAVEWTAVAEAVSYEVYCDGVLKDTTDKTEFTVTGLKVGKSYTFHVVAVRGNDRTTSNQMSATVTKDAQMTWGFTYYGPSTNAAGNGYTGSLNEDGKVTVFSTGGKGKIQPKSGDGVAFYYTAIPEKYNFTLRAKVTVDSWLYSNGQEGFGLMATDQLGVSGDSSSFYNNSYLAGCTKIEYRYEGDDESFKVYDVSFAGGTKYSMKLGLGVIERVGVTPKNQASFADSKAFETYSTTTTLEWAAGSWGKEAGTYNIVGNETSGNIEQTNLPLEVKTTFILEIQRNNTGYFVTYYDENGNVLCRQKYYDRDALNQLDEDYVYVGFFASRNATATFSDVQISTVLPKDDAPAEEKPVTKIDPTVTITSGAVSTSQEYEILVDTNVSGTITVQVDRGNVLENVPITGGQRYSGIINLKEYDDNEVRVLFKPDPDQDLGPDTVLSSSKEISATLTVFWYKGNHHAKAIYVSPDVDPIMGSRANGTKEYPYDLYTAVKVVVPGQAIILMEGTYKLPNTLRIERGMDGTADALIYMIPDIDAKTRPVLDFQQTGSGIVHGGDYWYFFGFDVTNSAPGQKGFQVSGNYNTLDQINTYKNGNSGIQISRMYGTDLKDYWPSYNLVLNCTSYSNCDPGYEDADGFAVKLTSGEGNVLDGCVAHHNADDGYDLYAKNETGPIGKVVIRNSVAYANGYLEDGTDAGNGNGFKMGGDSITGYHTLENCYAFYNKAKGIDSNSCPDIQVINCVSYNNGSHNVAFYTQVASKNTDYYADGLISFRNGDDKVFAGDVSVGEKISPQGTQQTSKYQGKTNYYWAGGSSVNAKGDKIKASMFVSLEFKGVARNADGTVNMQGFLELNDTAPDGVGVIGKGTPSAADIYDLEDDMEHNYGTEWTSDNDSYHWHECECGAKGHMEPHNFQWIIDAEATPTTPGKKHEECADCGFKRAAVSTYWENTNETVPPTTGGQEETEPTVPANPSVPGNTGSDNSGTVVAVVIVALLVLAAAAFAVIKFLLPKLKK